CHMEDSSKPSGIDFGAMIAFVAPGFVALSAAAYRFDLVWRWLGDSEDKQQGVGIVLLVLLASLSAGLLVSGARALLLDSLLTAHWNPWSVKTSSLDWGKLDSHSLTVLVLVRDNFYRYYQFYGNMFVALLVALVFRYAAPGKTPSWFELFVA